MKYIRVSDLKNITNSEISNDDLMYIIDASENYYSKRVEIGQLKDLFNSKYKLIDFDTKISKEIKLQDYAINNILIELSSDSTLNYVTLVLPNRQNEIYARKFYIRFQFTGELNNKAQISIEGGKVLVGQYLGMNELFTIESSNNIFNQITQDNKIFMFLECKRDQDKLSQSDNDKPNVVFLVNNYDTSKVMSNYP